MESGDVEEGADCTGTKDEENGIEDWPVPGWSTCVGGTCLGLNCVPKKIW